MFVVLIEDRHVDINVELFEELDDAISYAKETANEYYQNKEDYREIEIKPWLFYVKFSCEGDNIHIIEKNIHYK